MECLEPFGEIAKPVIEFGLKLGVQHFVYILHYRKIVDELNGCVIKIRLDKNSVNRQRDEAEKNLHKVEGAVIEWLRKVDEFETKVAEFGNDEGHGKTQFYYFWNRYRLAKQAQEMAEDVKKLIAESPKFDKVAYLENVTSNDATLSNAGFVAFGSTKSTMEDIMSKLEDSTVRMVGLYGPGGTGKSSLVKEIAKKARDEKLFNVVVKVEITANPDLKEIQEEIAYVLGLKLKSGSENVRADCLRRRLKKEKENTLVILDDLWDKLDFNKLGILLDDDVDVGSGEDDLRKMTSNDKKDLNGRVVKKEKLLGDYKGCKILLTSRNKKVLYDHEVNENSIFTLKRLDDKDALMLLQRVARIPDDEMSNFKQEIVKYCAGLPMAIVTGARALRDKSDSVWEATLDKLKKQELVEVQNSMEISVKMSYDHLETEELKSIFLLCAQMGHQPLIMDLVNYCFGLGILEGVHSLEEARERIRTSIQKLKDSTLMVDVSSSNHFNMHDMVRDAALSIAHKEQNIFTDWLELERISQHVPVELNDYKIAIGDVKTFSVRHFRMPNKYENCRSFPLQLKNDNDNILSQKRIKLLIRRVENLLLGDLNGVENVIDELALDGFPYLKHLSISDNTHIKYIINAVDFSHPQEVFPNLESLCLNKLRNIGGICCSPVTYASFSKLKSIKVKMCAQLKNLFSIHFFESNSLKEIIQTPVCCLPNLEIIDISESYSLKEIVEIPVNCDKVLFLKLHSLTLQSLPSLSSFYTRGKGPSVPQLTEEQTSKNDHIVILDVEDKTTLFGELVEIPNLGSLNLSSINIHKIWSDKPLSSFCSKNLRKLVVKDCNELRYLCSLSVANGLNKLKGLVISECRMMEKLFNSEANSADKVCIFPELEEIHLSQMKVLTEIWQPQVNADSFSSLISVHIERCEKLDKIFPSHMEGWFESLDSLKVVDCKSVEVIFEIEDPQQIFASGRIDTNVQHVVLEDLPNLKHVWSTYPEGILNFKKLQGLEVSACDKLCNVFPASVAKDAEKLEQMLVQCCEGLVEIVACENGSEANNEPLVFPELTNMTLYDLPNIKHFYHGRHPIECPKLKKLAVGYCEKLKTFQTPTIEITNEEERAVFSAEKLTPNLEHLTLGENEVKLIWHGEFQAKLLHKLKVLVMLNLHIESNVFAYGCVEQVPNIDKLEVSCYSFKVIFCYENPNADHTEPQSQLKVLTLESLPEPILRNLEFLEVSSCSCLTNLAPFHICFPNLMSLFVCECHQLENLFTSSIAKRLARLKIMEVKGCKSIKEIVSDGSQEDEIIFGQLLYLNLESLPNLTSFYKGSLIFPSLVQLSIINCHNMENLCAGTINADKLLEVKFQNNSDAIPLKIDLNSTIRKTLHATAFDYLSSASSDTNEDSEHGEN